MKYLVTTFILLGLSVGTVLRGKVSSDKERPVSKVIRLLKDMQKTLEKEQKEDEDIYEKMSCWCETNDKEKTAAIAEAEKRISSLTASIEEFSASASTLKTEIASLKKGLEENKQSLKEATAMRTKEAEAFGDEQSELTQSITALEGAITMLKRHHPHSDALMSMATKLRKAIDMHGELLKSSDRRTITNFLQQPAGYQSYASQSGEIFGILRQMKETFEANLSEEQKNEKQKAEAFAEMKAAKEAEIDAAQQQVEQKIQTKADAEKNNAEAKVDLDDTRNALTADNQFLMDLKEKCQASNTEWESRQKLRAEEIKAVSETIAILSSDDAHDLFSSSLGLLQIQKSSITENRLTKRHDYAKSHVAMLLQRAATKASDPALAMLAGSVQLDAFTKVKAAIDQMVADLKNQQEDEVKHRDFCTTEFNGNDKQTQQKSYERDDLSASMEELQQKIERLTEELHDLAAQNAELKVQMKKAGENREAANKEFQSTISDQRATQAILAKALQRMKAFYERRNQNAKEESNASSELMQVFGHAEPGAAAPPPPAGFKEYRTSQGASGVLTILQTIIEDSKALEKEALDDEQAAQKAYEDFVQDSNKSIAVNSRSITDKEENRAQANEEKTQAEIEYKATLSDLEQLASYADQLRASCNFVLKNFEATQEARAQEIEALQQAKAILSGAEFAS